MPAMSGRPSAVMASICSTRMPQLAIAVFLLFGKRAQHKNIILRGLHPRVNSAAA